MEDIGIPSIFTHLPQMDLRISSGSPYPTEEAANLPFVQSSIAGSGPCWATLQDSPLLTLLNHTPAFQATGPGAGLPF